MNNSIQPYHPIHSGDLPYDVYQQRQLSELNGEKILERSREVRRADKFVFNGNTWVPVPYEGYAVVAMLDENKGNRTLSENLSGLQKKLVDLFPVKNALFPLPASSFHQTIANTLSTSRFQESVYDVGLEEEFPYIIEEAFNGIFSITDKTTLFMRMTGLSLFETAIGILGIFECEDDYLRVLRFRAGFYANEMLSKLDVKMTRPFIGHITLAYIEQDLHTGQKDQLAEAVMTINRELDPDLYFNFSRCSLRCYRHLAEFRYLDHFPTHSL